MFPGRPASRRLLSFLLYPVAVQIARACPKKPGGALRGRGADTIMGVRAGGILLLIVLLGPLAGISGGEVAFTSAGLQQEAEALEEQFRQEQQNALAAIIAEEVSAYISDKAQTMGISCEVRVETEVGGEGVPVPVRVRLETPYHPELSAWIEEELEIPEERQIWQEE